MKPERRRLTFQLTPLLDLLLIVIFAQYMEVRQNAQSAEREIQQQELEVQQKEEELIARFNIRKKELEQGYADQVKGVDSLREEYDKRFQDILDQQQHAGSALAEALQLPGELVEQLTRLRSNGSTTDADKLQAAATRLRQAMEARGTEFIQYALRFDEMQKRVSVWEIHLEDNGQATITDGDQSQAIGFETESEFVSRTFEASKSFSDPKTLVLLFLSYGDTQAGYRRRATNAMPALIEQLRQDSGNTRWFDFSLLGFRPQGPVFRKNQNSNR